MKSLPQSATAAMLYASMLCAAPGASAQPGAQSSFDNFTYRRVDLNPDDGIDPGLVFHDGPVNGWADFRDDGGSRESAQADSRGGPIRVLIDMADGHLAGTADLTSASSLVRIAGGAGDTDTDSFLDFVLALYTQVIFSIDARATAGATATPSYAFATVGLNGRITDWNGDVFNDSDGLSCYIASSDTLSVTLMSHAVGLTGALVFGTVAAARSERKAWIAWRH